MGYDPNYGSSHRVVASQHEEGLSREQVLFTVHVEDARLVCIFSSDLRLLISIFGLFSLVFSLDLIYLLLLLKTTPLSFVELHEERAGRESDCRNVALVNLNVSLAQVFDFGRRLLSVTVSVRRLIHFVDVFKHFGRAVIRIGGLLTNIHGRIQV